jgi:predicted Zn-dependent peptidase
MREEPVSFEELETARNYFLGLVLSRRETLFQLGETLKNSWVNDLDLSDFDRAFREMKDLTPADIQNYSRKYLNPAEFVWVIAGKNA